MEPTNRHPLDCITNQSGLSMLECLIPYVDYPLKLPLALFIKFNEIRLIMEAFHSVDSLSSYGLNMSSNSLNDMLCAMTGISPEMLNMMMSMNNNFNISPDFFNNSGNNEYCDASCCQSDYSSSYEQQTNHCTGSHQNFANNNGTRLSHSIADIFAEYDLEQASRYDNEYHTINNDDN